MSIIRVHKTANYTVMSNNHFKEKQMSLNACSFALLTK